MCFCRRFLSFFLFCRRGSSGLLSHAGRRTRLLTGRCPCAHPQTTDDGQLTTDHGLSRAFSPANGGETECSGGLVPQLARPPDGLVNCHYISP